MKNKILSIDSQITIPLVSVIIPVYNVAPYLREALDSVINQTYTNLEIIIIDDGSTDGSGEICDEYKEQDNRIRVIHQDNTGLSTARNVGLDLMTGDVVAFLDPDDSYDLDYIKLMLETLNRDETDMVVCKFSILYSPELEISEASKVLPCIVSGVYDRYAAIQALYCGGLNVNVWNKLYKTSLWSSIHFSEGHVFEDNEVAYRIIALCNSITAIDNVLYTHWKRPGSITTTKSLNNTRDQLLARSRVEEFIRANVPDLFSEEQLKATRASRIADMISVYSCFSYKENEWKKFKKELRLQIIDTHKEIELKNVRIKAACLMIRLCPWILKPIYIFYRLLRRLLQAITGK